MLNLLVSGFLLRAALHLSTDSLSVVLANVIWTARAAYSLLTCSPMREAATGSTTLGKDASNCLTASNSSVGVSSFFSGKLVSLSCRWLGEGGGGGGGKKIMSDLHATISAFYC